MDIHRILQQLRADRDRLTKALEALEGRVTGRTRRSGSARRQHHLAAAGRRKLSMMMKKRWAERRQKAA